MAGLGTAWELRKMPVHEKQLAERANAELLRQIEEGLARSRDVIAQIKEVLGQRNANLSAEQLYRVSHK